MKRKPRCALLYEQSISQETREISRADFFVLRKITQSIEKLFFANSNRKA